MEYTNNNNLIISRGNIDDDMAMFFSVQEKFGGENEALSCFPQNIRTQATQLFTAESLRIIAKLCHTNFQGEYRLGYAYFTLTGEGKVSKVRRVRRPTQRKNQPTGRAIAAMGGM